MSGTRNGMIVAEGLRKVFGATKALDGLDLEVPAGSIYGLLGPNGSGKTTAVRVLATLTAPDSGRASVAGFDVIENPVAVRRHIRLVGQHAAVDERLPGRVNLVMFGRLCHLGGRGARQRANELLERFGLTHAADRLVSNYSGGMRRRLDLAASMIIAPDVLYLDEPSTGLDPRGRNEVWAAVRELSDTGTTVLLTTQYLDEADHLAQRVAVTESGRVIAEGTPDELKRQVGSDRLEIVVRDAGELEHMAATLDGADRTDVTLDRDRNMLSVPITGGFPTLAKVTAEIERSGFAVEDVSLRRSTLDDVFLRLTGHQTTAAPRRSEATS
jgi:ABC-2 type transport system ATP-binding protein